MERYLSIDWAKIFMLFLTLSLREMLLWTYLYTVFILGNLLPHTQHTGQDQHDWGAGRWRAGGSGAHHLFLLECSCLVVRQILKPDRTQQSHHQQNQLVQRNTSANASSAAQSCKSSGSTIKKPIYKKLHTHILVELNIWILIIKRYTWLLI